MLVDGNLSYAGISIVSLLSAGVGAFVGAYLKKKGENLATKEDFRDLKAQTAELKQATKEIEAKIDDQMWNRQRQWEMKRDVLLELIRAMGEIRNAQFAVYSAFKAYKAATFDAERNSLGVRKTESIEAWRVATEKLESGRILVAVLGNDPLNESLREFNKFLRRAYTAVTEDAPEEQFMESMKRMNRYDYESMTIVREALGIGAAPTPQSTGSSATPQ